MNYERRLEAYEKINRLDEHTLRDLKLRAFLDKHVYLRDALGSSPFQSAMQEALIKEGLEDTTEEEYLQAVLEYKPKEAS